MKQKLIDIYNILLQMEVKGPNVIMLADCIRALRQIIDEQTELEQATPEQTDEGK